MRRVTTTLALVLLAAGCADPEQHPPSAPAAGSTVSPAPSPTPTTLDVAQARTRYLEIVAPYNAALEEFESAANAGKAWTSLRALAGKVAETNAAHAQDLRTTAWPPPVQKPMAALLKETDTAQRYWERAARAKTAEELGEAVRAAARHSGAKPAGQIRSALGLPPYTEP